VITVIIVRVETSDIFRVQRKFERKPSRLLMMASTDVPCQYRLLYALDEPVERGR